MKFRVGQKIKIKNTFGASWLKKDKVYTVSEVNDLFEPRFKEGESPNPFWSPGDSSTYELIEEAAVKPGDKIKVINKRASWLVEGNVYTVGDVNHSKYFQLSDSVSPHSYWSCETKDYEIVDGEYIQPAQYKKGDVVIHLTDADKKDCYGVVERVDLGVNPSTTANVHVDWYKKSNKDFVVRGTYFESSLAINDITKPIKVDDYVNFKEDCLTSLFCIVDSIDTVNKTAVLSCYFIKTGKYCTTLTNILLNRLVLVDPPVITADDHDKHLGFNIGDTVDHKDFIGKPGNKTYGVIQEFTTLYQPDDAAIISWYYRNNKSIKNRTTVLLTNLVKLPTTTETVISHTKTQTEHEKDSSHDISKVCRSSWTIEPGKRSTGTPVQSGGSQATVVRGHVSYKAVTG